MIYVKGNLLESPVHIIAHQVNCLGIMGGGIALQIKNKWPRVFEDYKEFIEDWEYCNDGELPLGHCLPVRLNNEQRTVINIFGQNGIGGMATDYDAVRKAFIELKEYLVTDKIYRHDSQIPVGIPYKMGCGLGGGDWDTYRKMLQELEDEYNFLFIAHVLG